MGSIRMVGPPIEGADLAPLAADCETLQFGSSLSPADYEALATLLETRPDVWLRVLWDVPVDLDFLRHFPNLRRFTNHAFEATSLDALVHVPALTHLDVDAKRSRYDIRPLLQLPALESVRLEKCKGAAVLGELPTLRDVTLMTCDLGKRDKIWAHVDRAVLVQTKGVIPVMPSALNLSINATTLGSLKPLSEFTALRSLGLHTVRGFTALPDLSKLTELRRVVIYRAPQLEDLSALAALPNLRELELRDLPLTAKDVEFLADMPSLVSCRLKFASADEARRAAEFIPVATTEVQTQFSPFAWQHHEGCYSLLLCVFGFATEEFERLGLLENGHSWGEVARCLISELGASGFDVDCEADFFCVRSLDQEALRMLARRLAAIAADPSELLSLDIGK